MKYAIGIDIGTSGTKSVLFDINGAPLADETVNYDLIQRQNGWAEQRPDDWWKAAAATVRAVIEKSGVDAKDIACVGLSGQMHGLVMLDERSEVIRDSIIWCDQRTGEECDEIEKTVGRERLIKLTANPAMTGFTASKLMWVKKHERENYDRATHIMLPKDYVRFRLTGEYATDVSDASGTQLFDVKNRVWSDAVITALGIDASILPKVYESCEVTGYVTEEAARVTGLCEGTPVVGGAGDNEAAAVGMGTVRDGDAFTTIGTSGVVYAHTKEMHLDKLGRVHTFCSAVPNEWHVMGVTQGAGLSLKWFRDNFCGDIVEQCRKNGENPYAYMDEMAEKSGIGANRLLFLPYLMGERTPHLDPNARGAFVGLSATHTRFDMIRAIMEGVAYSLNDCLCVLNEMEIRPDLMLMCGGGGSSAVWRGICADVFALDSATASKEGPSLGAAILAMVGAGVYPSVHEACDSIVKVAGRESFNRDNHEKYMKFYGLYKKLYPHLKSDFAELSKL